MRYTFPFTAIAGQEEMKRALVLAAIDPAIGGVLIFGDRGTGKSTAVRGLASLLPPMRVVSGCRYHCDPGANGSACEECHERAAQGRLKSELVPVPVVDLPLGATEDRVVGALDLERALSTGEKIFEAGLLARAHRGFLYIDEVNLLEDHLVDLLLDVAASGENVVEREGLSVRHPARFVLIGSGNPEEGELRPQLLDRFGLSVEVSTPEDVTTRVDVVRRRDTFERDPHNFIETCQADEDALRKRIVSARKRLKSINTAEPQLRRAAELCIGVGTDGLRGELTLLRAARALAAFEGRNSVKDEHLREVAPSALRHRLRRNPLDQGALRYASIAPLRSCSVLDDFDDAALAEDAAVAAALLAIDAPGLGGAILRGRSGGACNSWLDVLSRFMPDKGCFRRLPAHAADDRILGGLDLAATLAAGRPIVERGILASADGCVLLIPSAERLPVATAAKVAAAMDAREVTIERDGLSQRHRTLFSAIALDEGIDEEQTPAALRDRLAFHLRLDAIGRRAIRSDLRLDEIAAAQARLPEVTLGDEAVEVLCGVAAAFGIVSFNAPILAVRAARCHAALHGRASPDKDDIAVAARLVLAPRASRLPQIDEEQPEDSPEHEPAEPESEPAHRQAGKPEVQDVVVAAAQAAIPPDLLARLMQRRSLRARGDARKGAGASQRTVRRGRPAGTQRGALRAGARLNVLETLRAAAPWQSLRVETRGGQARDTRRRIEVRPDDFRVRRMKDRRETVTVFVVDASGSSALHRLAEAKGAVELLLADCYVRRDQVALFSFGGRGTELLLPPTRSLTRAKRCLADLPGGGGTPLAEALERAAYLSQAIKRKNQTPAVVLLTDGRPNLCRDGRHGREAAEADAVAAAAALRHDGIASLLIDTSTRPDRGPARIAEAMGAQYVPLPHADARSVSAEVRGRLGR